MTARIFPGRRTTAPAGTNGTTYFYAANLQGDVVAILDSTGKAVVKYSCDAWGKLLSTTGSLASTLGVHNPLRYRGYVYDPETGLYYLRSRYYDPEMGRFINADAFASTGQGFLGFNMFAYCCNNLVIFADHTGNAAHLIIQVAVNDGGGGGCSGHTGVDQALHAAVNGIVFSNGQTHPGIIGTSTTTSTFLGALVDATTNSFLSSAFCNYAATLFVGTAVEVVTVAIKQTTSSTSSANQPKSPQPGSSVMDKSIFT